MVLLLIEGPVLKIVSRMRLNQLQSLYTNFSMYVKFQYTKRRLLPYTIIGLIRLIAQWRP
jgi:hypothetical protein